MLCATPAAAQAGSSADLGAQLAKHVAIDAEVELRDPLLREAPLASPRSPVPEGGVAPAPDRPPARSRRRRRKADRARAELARREADVERRRLLTAFERSPEKAICHVFGSYCRQALQVARCESGVQTTAQNGQYLGLFQMGSSERRLFGHGESAIEQAQAAYRYFVRSGRDWSPWSCKPWY